MHQHAAKNLQAIIWVSSSVALFSVVYASGKLLGGDVAALQILFLRYLGGVLSLLIIYTLQPAEKRKAVFHSKKASVHVTRAICGSSGGISMIYASTHMPVADAAAIGLLDAVFLVILGVILLKERISPPQVLAMLICFGGAALLPLAQGAFRTTNWFYLMPILAAFMSAILIAVESIIIKQLTRTESALCMLVFVNILGALLLIIPAIILWQSMSWLDALSCFLLGPIAILAQYLTIRGYQLADVVIVGPVNYTWLIFAALLGWCFFDEIPTAATLVGGGLIVAGGIILALTSPTQKR